MHFGKYLLQRKLAEGGMAEVFLARQGGVEGFEKPVVIKRILPRLSGQQHFVDMFLNEAKVAARLSHPALCQVFDFGRVDGQYFIAMEFIHGENLRNLTRVATERGLPPPPGLVARVVADMLGGLHYAHTRCGPDGRRLGLVHRDVSPQNVLCTHDGGVKVVDFGIVKATEADDGNRTQAGLLKGKYAYMSPEQCRGRPIDARSDVFAAGILLWELLTWRRLFKRDSDLATIVAVAADDAVPRASSVAPEVPAALDAICARALARAVDDRYPSAQEMQRELEEAIRQGWQADSIRLQQYMREVFAEKLGIQEKALREAGAASIDDFLVRVEEGTPIAWIDGPAGGDGGGDGDGVAVAGAGLDLPSPTPPGGPRTERMLPSALPTLLPTLPPPPPRPLHRRAPAPVDIAPVPNWPPAPPPGGVPEHTGSTLRHAVGQAVPRVSPAAASPPARWRRPLVVVATSALVVAAGIGVVVGPSSRGPEGVSLTPAAGPAPTPPAPSAKLRVLLDRPAALTLDGVAHGEAVESELEVAAGAEHELLVKSGAVERRVRVPPLPAGAVRPIRLKLGQ